LQNILGISECHHGIQTANTNDGKGREASTSEASGEGNEDLQQEHIVRPGIDERKDNEFLNLYMVAALRLFVE
jgi:hypothetical protein